MHHYVQKDLSYIFLKSINKCPINSPGAMGLNLELRVKVFFSADSGTLGVAFHHPGG
jgi:hypothetical protein